MRKKQIEEAYALLKQIGIVRSESEFARNWLGKSESYLRCMRVKGTQPSNGAVAVCAARMQALAGDLARDPLTAAQSSAVLRVAYTMREQVLGAALDAA